LLVKYREIVADLFKVGYHENGFEMQR
jgi:hypothetical protein